MKRKYLIPHSTFVRKSTIRIAACLVVLLILCSSGCAPTWVYSYVEAERQAKPAEKPILIVYRDHLDVKSGKVQDMVESPSLASATSKYVRCSLISAFDPNRRYLAQYGVTSPPALVIVHPDGTFHCLRNEFSTSIIKEFLTTSKAPGERPRVDMQVPRPTDYLVRAEGTFEKALDKARRQNRKLMIVYKWWLNPDSTELISRMSRPEVANRCTETVNCVLDWDYVPNRKHVAQYGVTKFPAIIVVNQDGSYQTHQGLGTVNELVRFLEKALSTRTR